MKKNLSLSNICKKLKRVSHPNHWCGYLRPDEILVLLDAGARETHDSKRDWMSTRKAKGDCNPSWFYFTPSKRIQDMVDPEYFMDYYRRKVKHP